MADADPDAGVPGHASVRVAGAAGRRAGDAALGSLRLGVDLPRVPDGAAPVRGGGRRRRGFLTGGGAVEIPAWLRGQRLGELLAAVTAREPERATSGRGADRGARRRSRAGSCSLAPEAAQCRRRSPSRGERRHLTVMFCDLVGSSALGQRLAADGLPPGGAGLPRARRAGDRALRGPRRPVPGRWASGLLRLPAGPRGRRGTRRARGARDPARARRCSIPGSRRSTACGCKPAWASTPARWWSARMGSGETRATLALGDTPNVAARLEALRRARHAGDQRRHAAPRGGALRDRGPRDPRAQGHLRADPRLPRPPAERGREPSRPGARADALRGTRAGARALCSIASSRRRRDRARRSGSRARRGSGSRGWCTGCAKRLRETPHTLARVPLLALHAEQRRSSR